MRPVRAAEVNAFLQEVAGRRISLKDFRTLVASAAALKALAATEPADSERQRRRQVREAVVEIAEELANTPTVCRTSYVHDAVIAAFEAGALKRHGSGRRSRQRPRPSCWRASWPGMSTEVLEATRSSELRRRAGSA